VELVREEGKGVVLRCLESSTPSGLVWWVVKRKRKIQTSLQHSRELARKTHRGGLKAHASGRKFVELSKRFDKWKILNRERRVDLDHFLRLSKGETR
jgi:hypothetical protein